MRVDVIAGVLVAVLATAAMVAPSPSFQTDGTTGPGAELAMPAVADSDVATPESTTTSSTTVATATTTTTTVPFDTSIRQVDLANTTLPANSCLQDDDEGGWAASPPIPLVDGFGEAGDEDTSFAEVWVDVVGYADFDGNRVEDVVLSAYCGAGGTYHDTLALPLTIEDGELVILGGQNLEAVSTEAGLLGLTDAGYPRWARISELSLDGTAIVADEIFDETGDQAPNSLTGQALVRWTWDNGSWMPALG